MIPMSDHRVYERIIGTEAPWWSGPVRGSETVSGDVCAKDGKTVLRVKGCWSDHLMINEHNGAKTRKMLWKKIDHPKEAEKQFNFTSFALSLNALDEEMPRDRLAPTDCRLRPDQRALENADLDMASVEKHRLEEKQRAKRKARETMLEGNSSSVASSAHGSEASSVSGSEAGSQHVNPKEPPPKYFVREVDPDTGTVGHRFTGEYFRIRDDGGSHHDPDIY